MQERNFPIWQWCKTPKNSNKTSEENVKHKVEQQKKTPAKSSWKQTSLNVLTENLFAFVQVWESLYLMYGALTFGAAGC